MHLDFAGQAVMSRLDRIVGRSRGQQYESALPERYGCTMHFIRVGTLIPESAHPCSVCRRPAASDPPLLSWLSDRRLGDRHENSKKAGGGFADTRLRGGRMYRFLGDGGVPGGCWTFRCSPQTVDETKRGMFRQPQSAPKNICHDAWPNGRFFFFFILCSLVYSLFHWSGGRTSPPMVMDLPPRQAGRLFAGGRHVSFSPRTWPCVVVETANHESYPDPFCMVRADSNMEVRARTERRERRSDQILTSCCMYRRHLAPKTHKNKTGQLCNKACITWRKAGASPMQLA
ncbi:hypothetical protein MAPG_02316 [Magnaporthiopsis poae ATCC 64411]|uniref:Uncharacterized protein n=1 Tax=Magnaporthiopsis poae (strain ATCC 64411 / 73-15) TaxID=644358 RepID=A0A0C4DR17_MAGP6|nr:hypothetical protein MAPG_02316 [Magnaporthiopsis poae ATCC 64411]